MLVPPKAPFDPEGAYAVAFVGVTAAVAVNLATTTTPTPFPLTHVAVIVD